MSIFALVIVCIITAITGLIEGRARASEVLERALFLIPLGLALDILGSAGMVIRSLWKEKNNGVSKDR